MVYVLNEVKGLEKHIMIATNGSKFIGAGKD